MSSGKKVLALVAVLVAGGLASVLRLQVTLEVGQWNMEDFKNLTSGLQSIVTIIAFVIGGGWALWTFVLRRQRYPHIATKHTISHWKLDKGNLLLHVAVQLSNVGQVMFSPVYGVVRVQKILPLEDNMQQALAQGYDLVEKDEREVSWPRIAPERECIWQPGTIEIEPGESFDVHFDFVILTDEVRTIEVYSHFRNSTKKGSMGWSRTAIYDVSNQGDENPWGGS